ncbi:SMP-30/gluconolactonase/LRE family protein [Ralstonia nicotianae]|uniref:SMP-30/gluconolactonase/LRE family protein n=4 Tax=Ralstonia pseudosolanacearum TaxID=1310165 RepID=UPI0002C0789B|nr:MULTISPECIES: SMP-30/gluconolactonase/LRE family protein [Ralstonia]KAF3458532.1 gluconolactonase [Ralstonia solanacearum]AGH86897.1 Gluconolactonase [Ralstonia pseudosolanacearum FQY_4]MDO3515600.1 SMP-30/gluconolactonase/LRE family protein [Ralstonia pseudosolanacearum]MDO3541155.1 SMP-30/gluconolactonase/LRE family protein [Ralstonia pseudosolanacearum]NKA81327.1 gluconolactonase [Ralstonia solanacearum]
MHAGVERIGTMRCGVGESPVWHPREQALYWTDIPGRTLWRWNPATGHADAWPLPEMAGCIAMLDDGWALAMETGVFRIPQPEAGLPVPAPRQLAPVQHSRPDMRFNDGRCDRQGRFWSGTMVLDTALGVPAGKLYRLDGKAGRVEAVADDLIVPNGLAFSPDGRTLYLSDSHVSRQAVWAFDYDIDTGIPHNRRLFIDMHAHPGRPDGAAVDADGCYWICGNDAGLVHRFTPQGRLDRSLPVPVAKPAMCAFGGPGLDTLFVTSIRVDGDSLSGATFALRPGTRGLDEPTLRMDSP